MQKLQKAIDAIPDIKNDKKGFAKRILLLGHIRQLGIIETLLDVKLKNLKRL